MTSRQQESSFLRRGRGSRWLSPCADTAQGEWLGLTDEETRYDEPEASKAQEEKCTVVPSLLLHSKGAVLEI